LSQQPLANIVVMGDETKSTAELQSKKSALTSAIAALDTINVAGHFAGTDMAARISSLQAQLRTLLVGELEQITHRVARTGPYTSR
jgi:hypothetical protein